MTEPSSTTSPWITDPAANGDSRIDPPTHWLGKLSDWISDFFSAILVKECRQSLKSKSFVWTYFTLLIVVAVWINYRIAYTIYDGTTELLGRNLLQGLFVIAGFPLGLVIPFSASRSLAKEYETGSIQLVAITTMKPWQIVIGKLGSSILQMLVYLAVLAPCILMTYLLRGVSLLDILMFLYLGILFSIGLTVLGIFLGGVIKSRTTLGTIISLGFLLLLGWLYYLWCWFVDESIGEMGAMSFDDESIIVMFSLFSVISLISLLLLTAACSQISFASDNKSTGVRVVMLIQQCVFLAFFGNLLISFNPGNKSVLAVLAGVAGHYWLIMGGLMIGESSHLSRRVRRSLPKGAITRPIFGLLMPGRGRGFLYAISMMWLAVLTVGILLQFAGSLRTFFPLMTDPGGMTPENLSISEAWDNIETAVILLWLPTAFLSIAYLLVGWVLRRRRQALGDGTGPLTGLLITVITVAVLSLGPAITHMVYYPSASYTLQHSWIGYFCWYYLFNYINDSRLLDESIFLIYLVFAPFVLWAVLSAVRELRVQPVTIPERVLQDKPAPERQLPVGESIEEIFGTLGGEEGKTG